VSFEEPVVREGVVAAVGGRVMGGAGAMGESGPPLVRPRVGMAIVKQACGGCGEVWNRLLRARGRKWTSSSVCYARDRQKRAGGGETHLL